MVRSMAISFAVTLSLFIATAAGCGGSAIAMPAEGEYTPLLSVVGGLVVSDDTKPQPSPTPAPGGICDNCNGTGKLGDGTVSVPCPVCGGDGHTDNEPPAKPVSVLVPTPDCQCVDCKCSPCLCKPTSPAEPAKHEAPKQEAKPAPTNTASQLQTSVRQQINAEPRYEYRTENYGFRGRRQRTAKVLVGGGATQSAPVYYGGSMCGPNGCN